MLTHQGSAGVLLYQSNYTPSDPQSALNQYSEPGRSHDFAGSWDYAKGDNRQTASLLLVYCHHKLLSGDMLWTHKAPRHVVIAVRPGDVSLLLLREICVWYLHTAMHTDRQTRDKTHYLVKSTKNLEHRDVML